MMNKEFIPYEQALSLKELEFNEECIGYYENNPDRVIFFGGTRTNSNWSRIFTKAGKYRLVTPLYQQAFRWFREKYNLSAFVESYIEPKGWGYTINNDSTDTSVGFKSHEEAELECLKKLIEIVKSKS